MATRIQKNWGVVDAAGLLGRLVDDQVAVVERLRPR
jgi:hypothetical protein